MAKSPHVCDALYLAWKLDSGLDAAQIIADGADRNLYRLRSWMVAKNGDKQEARALLVPAAPLEDIAQALFQDSAEPLRASWVATSMNPPSACG
jgi:hypothetical protein